MPSFSRILLFYDGTREAQSALRRCAEMSLAFSTPVDVVTVVDSVDVSARYAGLLTDVAFSQMEELAGGTLRDAIARLDAIGVCAQGHVVFGRVVDAIPRHAARFSSDLVIIGYRAPRRLRWWYAARPVHLDLAERMKGSTIVTVTVG